MGFPRSLTHKRIGSLWGRCAAPHLLGRGHNMSYIFYIVTLWASIALACRCSVGSWPAHASSSCFALSHSYKHRRLRASPPKQHLAANLHNHLKLFQITNITASNASAAAPNRKVTDSSNALGNSESSESPSLSPTILQSEDLTRQISPSITSCSNSGRDQHRPRRRGESGGCGW
ncbi:uncharacterized protein BDZ99DRAFT_297008 [Mytilinidion resinicola]|uniref:Uncharacterized protein n=1 Tax=Mytilinidion resinicola TaxID=574789 RepID=A0A6A6YQU8_9PEZI|nr:uncharacterized protein BDZ99DRAFT_297008 [Mytilinidion resinicola]KAF2811160.1 hypothetical protein BDZ99DRAFT_297008 [Mytilinidion resinicola]